MIIPLILLLILLFLRMMIIIPLPSWAMDLVRKPEKHTTQSHFLILTMLRSVDRHGIVDMIRFVASHKQNCVCHFDHGYDEDTIPPDMNSLPGFGEFVVGSNNNIAVAVGMIHESIETFSDAADSTKCYSNSLHFQNPYKLIGDGACTANNNDKKDLYDFVSYDNVMKLELCGSPVYCGRRQVRGFSYDDVHHCICYFEDGWNLDTIPKAMKELPGYNALGAYFGNTATGEITGSDEGSLFRKCYANHNFQFRTIKSLRGIGLQVRRRY
mmetsp:Transcript_16565/g.24443  ORF Transcript_16565/g.24443 Transcript_16565/m.24443 type:complete len:269 (-) Transcript_16565:119-925(-)